MGGVRIMTVRELSDDILKMLDAHERTTTRRKSLTRAMQLLTDQFVKQGASLTEIAETCEGEAQRRRVEYEQTKKAERKRGKRIG
jgi:hypothetical protein